MHRTLLIVIATFTASILLARNTKNQITQRDLQIFSLLLPCVRRNRPEKCTQFGGIQLGNGALSSRRLDLKPGTSQNFCLSGLLSGTEEEAIVQCQVTSRTNTHKLTLTLKDADNNELCRASSNSERQACVVSTTTDTIVANVASADSRASRVQIVCTQNGRTSCTGPTLQLGTTSVPFDLAFGETKKYCVSVESGKEVECKTNGQAGGDVSLWVAFGDVGNVPPAPMDETCFSNQGTVEESCKVSKSVGTIVNVQVAATKPSQGVNVLCT